MPPVALLDANLFISYLLSTNQHASATAAIFQAAVADQLMLLFPPAVEQELRVTVASRPHLAARLSDAVVNELVATIRQLAVPSIPVMGPFPPIGRDPKDDYLIAHAVVADADYLVSWDRDLLDMGQVDRVSIVSPPELPAVLRDAKPREMFVDEG